MNEKCKVVVRGVRITLGGSHRQRHFHFQELRRLGIPHGNFYPCDLGSKRLIGTIPLSRLDDARAVKGINKARDQRDIGETNFWMEDYEHL